MKMNYNVLVFLASFFIVATSCTSSLKEPDDKKEYLENYMELSNKVENQKDCIDKKFWIEIKEQNNEYSGRLFSKFKEELVLKEILEVGNCGRKINKYYEEYKKEYGLLEQSLISGNRDEIAERIRFFYNNNMSVELDKYLDDAIRVGGEVRDYPKIVLIELGIQDEYKQKWGESW